ncbi:MAG TPA: hypothetical protein VHG91_20220 [Longimicrobium sp.]|nr:hypothetical protein [Longimicrobium sp.]
MKKLRLEVEHLSVQTFHVTPGRAGERGTVWGAISYPAPATCVNTDCDQNTCGTCNNTCPDSCYQSCVGTCGNSCLGTCVEPTCASCAVTCGEGTCISCEATCPGYGCTRYKDPC